jgi:hypothetical protein
LMMTRTRASANSPDAVEEAYHKAGPMLAEVYEVYCLMSGGGYSGKRTATASDVCDSPTHDGHVHFAPRFFFLFLPNIALRTTLHSPASSFFLSSSRSGRSADIVLTAPSLAPPPCHHRRHHHRHQASPSPATSQGGGVGSCRLGPRAREGPYSTHVSTLVYLEFSRLCPGSILYPPHISLYTMHCYRCVGTLRILWADS